MTGQNPYAPPTSPLEGAPAPTPPPFNSGGEEVTLAQRIGAACMMLNALLLIVQTVVIKAPDSGLDSALPMLPMKNVFAAVIDLALGIIIFAGSRKVVIVSIVRVLLGLLFGVGTQLAAGDKVSAVLQVVVSASLLALFVGQASKARMTIGAVGFAGYFLIAGLGLVALSGGTSLFGGMIARMSGDYAKEPVHDLHGLKADWKLTAPGDEWRLRSDASAKKDNPIVDRWISRPDLDAHVLIIAEQVPGKTIPIEAYTDAILQSGAKAGTDFKILERKKLEGRTDARFVHTTSTIKGLKIEHYYGLFTTGDRAYQVVAFAAQGTFPKVSDELRQIIESFQPAP